MCSSIGLQTWLEIPAAWSEWHATQFWMTAHSLRCLRPMGTSWTHLFTGHRGLCLVVHTSTLHCLWYHNLGGIVKCPMTWRLRGQPHIFRTCWSMQGMCCAQISYCRSNHACSQFLSIFGCKSLAIPQVDWMEKLATQQFNSDSPCTPRQYRLAFHATVALAEL